MLDLRARRRQLGFLLNARQLRLLSELQSIYPIAKITGISGGLSGGDAGRHNRRVSAFDEWLTGEQEVRSDKHADQASRQMPISEAPPTRGLSAKRSRDPRNSEQLLSIRGLILPMRDMLSHEEEQVSTALGYVAHLVHLLAKVFQIALRYEMVPGGSRSRIRNCLPLKTQAEYLEYPLYWRGVSRCCLFVVCLAVGCCCVLCWRGSFRFAFPICFVCVCVCVCVCVWLLLRARVEWRGFCVKKNTFAHICDA
jgi:hypothetical protein